MKELKKALTFDDILLVPAHSEVLPKEVDLKPTNLWLMLPLSRIDTRVVAFAFSTLKAFVVYDEPAPFTSNLALGLVVPIPTLLPDPNIKSAPFCLILKLPLASEPKPVFVPAV